MNKILAWNIGKWKKRCLHVLAMGRTLLLLMIISALFFVVLGLGGMAEKRLNNSPVSSMKGFASAVSSRFFVDMLGMEMPHLTQKEQTSAISGENLTSFVFQLLTNVNPQDPKSLIAREMPGMGSNQPVLLRPGSGNEKAEAPEDYQPGPGLTDTASAGGGKPGSGCIFHQAKTIRIHLSRVSLEMEKVKKILQRRMVRKTIQAHRQQAKSQFLSIIPIQGKATIHC